MTDIDRMITVNQIKRARPYLTPQDMESLYRIMGAARDHLVGKGVMRPRPVDDYGSRERDDTPDEGETAEYESE